MSLPSAEAQTSSPAQTQAPGTGKELYKLVKTIDLPGGHGGSGGQIVFDAETATVWLAQGPARNIVVLETAANTVRQVIEGVDNPTGICFSEHYAFIADAGANATAVVGKRSFEKAASLKSVGRQPSNVYFDTKGGTLWVAAADGEMTIYKAVGHGGLKRFAGLRFKPAPAKEPLGTGLYVHSKIRIYQPVDDAIDVIDPISRKIEHAWKLTGTSQIMSLAYDAKTDRLIAGTAGKMVVVVDAKTGKTMAKIPVKGEIGAVAFDPGLRRAIAADRAGQIDVLDVDLSALLGTLPSDSDVHALTIDPHTHFVYVYRDQANKVDVLAPG